MKEQMGGSRGPPQDKLLSVTWEDHSDKLFHLS